MFASDDCLTTHQFRTRINKNEPERTRPKANKNTAESTDAIDILPLDANASDEAKSALAQTMVLKDVEKKQIASALVEVFDRVYTYPLLRWTPFFRSLLFTFAMTIVFLIQMRDSESV
jgi:hypothetical protein